MQDCLAILGIATIIPLMNLFFWTAEKIPSIDTASIDFTTEKIEVFLENKDQTISALQTSSLLALNHLGIGPEQISSWKNLANEWQKSFVEIFPHFAEDST